MSQCPLGFKGTPPVGHPPVAGMRIEDTNKPSSDASKLPRLFALFKNQYLILFLEALFLLTAVYIARNGFPAFVTKTFGGYLPRGNSSIATPRARVPSKTE